MTNGVSKMVKSSKLGAVTQCGSHDVCLLLVQFLPYLTMPALRALSEF
ncbi:hypothetical protein [Aeromonas veronii]